MPDENGNITAGGSNVAAQSTPVAPDIGANMPDVPGAAPNLSQPSQPLAQPPRPHPSFFRQLLFSLGKGLIEGTKAGLQAPLGPQGPAIAARTAIEAPQKQLEQLNQNQLDQLKIATAEINLQMAHQNLLNLQDERVTGYYKAGQKFASDLQEKGDAEPFATGTKSDIHKLYIQQKQLNPDQPMLPYPNPGASMGDDNEYVLLKMDPKGRFDEDVPEQTIKGVTIKTPDGQTIEYPDEKIPGAKKGQRIDAWQAISSRAVKIASMRDMDINKSAAIISKEQEGKATRDVRMKIATLQSQTGRYKADLAAATASGDKLKVQALGKLIQASNNMSKVQAPLLNKAWESLTKQQREEVTTASDALKAAKSEYDAVSKKTIGGPPSGPVQRTKFKPGTPITKDIADNYKKLAGGDKALAQKWAKEDGLVWSEVKANAAPSSR